MAYWVGASNLKLIKIHKDPKLENGEKIAVLQKSNRRL